MKTEYTFQKVRDKSNRRIRGLWLRNGSYYVQTTITDHETGLKKVTKLRLDKVKTPAEATQKMYELFKDIEEGKIISRNSGPDFKTYREHYKKVSLKAPKTVYNENHFLEQWEKFLGADVRLGAITPKNILAYRAHVLKKGNSARTANLHSRALKQLLLMAKTEGHIKQLPTADIKQLKYKTAERRLYSTDDLMLIVTTALKHKRTGKQFSDYIKLLMFSGARCSEALKLKWENVDWENDQIVFNGDISKGETRRVDFSPNLKTHLLSMKDTATSDWLFPSTRTKKADPIKSFKKIMNEIRDELKKDELKFKDFTFHLTRHYFISRCVMAGIDYMTIAKWVGHKDGGVLIGTIYGHLNRQHMKDQAAKLVL